MTEASSHVAFERILTPTAVSERLHARRVCGAKRSVDDVDSLNLTVATGIAVERLTRGTRGRGILPGRTDAQT
jgi:hypothetical protein